MVSYKTVPAKFKWVKKQLVVREASTKVVPVPATYKTVKVKIKTADEATRMVQVPATYKTVTERVLVSPEREMWKRGEGTHVNENGILCKVKVPARYKTVSKRVLVQEADTKEYAVPAKFSWVEKTVVATPATTRTIELPEVKKTVTVKELVEPARRIAFSTPAKFRTVTKKVLAEAPQAKWAPILCKTNATPMNVLKVQKALRLSGYNPGRVDGVLGRDTAVAIKRFQSKNNLASGGLTMETLKALNVNL